MSDKEYVTVRLTQGYEAIIDADDLPLVALYTWHASPKRIRIYACGSLKPHLKRPQQRKVRVYMHRLIMSAPKGAEVDHINGDGLDNRKSNLRVCDGSVNRMNYGKRAQGKRATAPTSQFRGVSFRRDRQKWQGRIQFRGKGVSRLFDTEIAAARFYNEMAIQMLGKDATWLNDVEIHLHPIESTAAGYLSDETYEKAKKEAA